MSELFHLKNLKLFKINNIFSGNKDISRSLQNPDVGIKISIYPIPYQNGLKTTAAGLSTGNLVLDL